MKEKASLVSVVIPCYNHALFLPKAIESVLQQTHEPVEIVVVDDGSTDNTREVALRYPSVKYVHQKNAGLSAARNTGIVNSTGGYLLFLDADDWLLPEGIETNLSYFSNGQTIGFVSGSYRSFYVSGGDEKTMTREVSRNPYADLLLRNHIKMHASVLFPRWVFESLKYDTSLKASEDWDLYLHITRHHPIVQHERPIAVYRRYSSSMSRNGVVMLKTGLRVLEKQIPFATSSLEKNNLRKGQKHIIQKFSKRAYNNLLATETPPDRHHLLALFRHNKPLFAKYLWSRLKSTLGLKKSKLTYDA